MLPANTLGLSSTIFGRPLPWELRCAITSNCRAELSAVGPSDIGAPSGTALPSALKINGGGVSGVTRSNDGVTEDLSVVIELADVDEEVEDACQ